MKEILTIFYVVRCIVSVTLRKGFLGQNTEGADWACFAYAQRDKICFKCVADAVHTFSTSQPLISLSFDTKLTPMPLISFPEAR